MNGQRLLLYGSRYYPLHTTLQYQQRRLLSQTKTIFQQQQQPGCGKLGQPALGRPLSNKNNDSKISKTDWGRTKPTDSSRNKPDYRNNNNNSNNNKQRRPVPEKRDWTRPADLDKKQQQSRNKPAGARGGSNTGGNNRYNNNKKPPAGETASQRKERKRREEEVALLMKQEEMEMQKLRAKQKKQSQTEKQTRDVYIPEIINVANLSRILGIRLGEPKIFLCYCCQKGG